MATWCLAASGSGAFAATYTWQGAGGDGNWATGTNWVGDAAPAGGGHILHFTGHSQLSTHNDRLTSVGGIHFEKDAGAFTLSGNAISLTGNVVNASAETQVISLDVTLSAHRTFDVKAGKIVVEGEMTSTASNRGITKWGSGTLELTGQQSYQGITAIYRGAVVLDASTGGIGSSSSVRMGDATNYEVGSGASFVVKGGDYDFGKSIGVYNMGTNTIKAEGVSLTFSSFAIASQATSHFDVSQAGSSIALTTAPSLVGGRIAQTTMKGAAGKTTFVSLDTGAGNNVVSLVDLVDLTTNPGTLTTTHGVVNGSYHNNALNRNLNSLTLRGDEGGVVTGENLRPREILMEEGTGNFSLETEMVTSHASYSLFVHQYSTDGILSFGSSIVGEDYTGGFVKAGPGEVHITETGAGAFRGATRVQSGRLRLDGALSKTSLVTVYEGAILSGSGSIGSIGNETAANIREGGMLEASSAGALEIIGTLDFQAESTFSMTLSYSGAAHVQASDAITLFDEVNLQLSLAQAPVLDESVLLLKGASLAGEFATINGAMFDPEGTFRLGHESLTYQFRISYDNNEVRVQAISVIPEPNVVALSGFSIAFLLLVCRLRRNGPVKAVREQLPTSC